MKIEEKIDKIYEMVHNQNVLLAKTVVHQDNQAKKIAQHEDKIQVLHDYKNQWIGKTSFVSLFFGGIGAGLTLLIDYLTSPHQPHE